MRCVTRLSPRSPGARNWNDQVPESSQSPVNCLAWGAWMGYVWGSKPGLGTLASLTIFPWKEGPRSPPNAGRSLLSSSGLQQGEELLPRLGGSGLGGLS